MASSQLTTAELIRTVTRAGADAIYRAAAMELGESVFATYDRRQAEAANDCVFQVVSPGRPHDWYRS